MRLSLVLALPAVVIAATEEQKPLVDRVRGWFSKASAAIPTSVPDVLPHPMDAGAAKVAQVAVHNLNFSNWQDVLKPQPGKATDWMVYITGGNSTCMGNCKNTTLAWNTSAAVLSATSTASLASLDCESAGLLCSLWAVGPPSIYYMQFPASGATPTVRYIKLNTTATTSSDIADLHRKRGFEKTEPYNGIWHPFDGVLAKTGMSVPAAYALYAFSKMPAWLPMILVSVLSRSLISRRMPQGQAGAAGQAAPGTAAPAAAKK